MTLRTVAIPDPPAGSDWTTVVPGRYLYDVTGITATLTTPGGPGFPNSPDASGNANNATYSGGTSTFVAGLVPGNDALKRVAGLGDQINAAHPIVDVTSPFTVVVWLELDAPVAGDIHLAIYTTAPPANLIGWDLSIPAGFPTRFFVSGARNVGGLSTVWETAAGTVPYDSAPHMLAVTFDPGASPQNNLYLDGVLIPWDVTDLPFVSDGPSDRWGFNITDSPLITDEIAIFPGALTGGQVATLYAAGATFATYEPAVLALLPFVYYHLDGAAIAIPRQVTLVVATSTGLVEDVPSGFPLATGPGPYNYSWQPNLPASSQTPDGALTTIALPRILIPAGYTIGTDTLDIGPSDQWSNITLWWDDTAMLSSAELNPYAYPPSIKLVYRQEGAMP